MAANCPVTGYFSKRGITVYINGRNVCYRDKIVLVESKNWDKLFAYTSVFAAVTESNETVMLYEMEACRSFWQACRWRSRAGFVNFKNKTVDCHMQARWGKPGKVQIRKKSIQMITSIVRAENKLRRESRFAAVKVKRISHTIRIGLGTINLSGYNRKPNLEQAGRWLWKCYCCQRPGGIVELPSVSGLASFLPVPVDGWKLSRQGKTRLRISPGRWSKV